MYLNDDIVKAWYGHTPYQTVGSVIPEGSSAAQQRFNEDSLARYLSQRQEQKQMSGNKPIVVCNGQATEAKDLTEAQALAERLAHQHQADAYILKPVKKVAPKRDVVTTDLE